MQWFAQAPANIALIKYMGKKDDKNNIPINPSLSYTLNNLLSSVMLEQQAGNKDFWEPMPMPGMELPFQLSKLAQQRFLAHLQRIKEHYQYVGGFVVRSSNNFPQGSGLASSASSFAALTKCAIRALCELTCVNLPLIEEAAALSRLGSGSSCRSFFSPWALWDEDMVQGLNLPYSNLLHQVIIISHEEKKVLSSEAHQRIKTSPLYATRVQRAQENLKVLLTALEGQDWESAYHVCWKEFQDMHQLFETCEKPFTYRTQNTTLLLDALQKLWEKEKDGPIVTMDAGPNIHLLYRVDQERLARQFKKDYVIGNYDVL